MTTTNQSRTTYMVQLGLLTAIIIILAFTPIGYIRTLGVEITLIVVPVVVGAIVLGPSSGAILGLVFGITSFIQCFGLSPFGAALLNINPVYTFIMCIVPRVIMGWLTGVVFAVLRKKASTRRSKNIAYIIASITGPILNTVLFILALLIFFYRSDYIQGFVTALGASNIFGFAIGFVGINGLIEAIACAVVGTAIASVLSRMVVANRQNTVN